MDTNSKKCSICKQEKSKSEFNRDKYKKDGLEVKCRICCKKYKDKYRKNNKEKIKEGDKKYRQKNKERVKDYHIKYYRLHREEIKERKRQWCKNKPEIVRESTRKRRALKKQIREAFDSEMEAFVFNIFKCRCQKCKTEEDLCIDHFRPLSKGNKLKVANALVLCRSCNGKKYNKLPEEYFGVKRAEQLDKILKLNHLKWLNCLDVIDEG